MKERKRKQIFLSFYFPFLLRKFFFLTQSHLGCQNLPTSFAAANKEKAENREMKQPTFKYNLTKWEMAWSIFFFLLLLFYKLSWGLCWFFASFLGGWHYLLLSNEACTYFEFLHFSSFWGFNFLTYPSIQNHLLATLSYFFRHLF